jgi:hypothetical protein
MLQMPCYKSECVVGLIAGRNVGKPSVLALLHGNIEYDSVVGNMCLFM